MSRKRKKGSTRKEQVVLLIVLAGAILLIVLFFIANTNRPVSTEPARLGSVRGKNAPMVCGNPVLSVAPGNAW